MTAPNTLLVDLNALNREQAIQLLKVFLPQAPLPAAVHTDIPPNWQAFRNHIAGRRNMHFLNCLHHAGGKCTWVSTNLHGQGVKGNTVSAVASASRTHLGKPLVERAGFKDRTTYSITPSLLSDFLDLWPQLSPSSTRHASA